MDNYEALRDEVKPSTPSPVAKHCPKCDYQTKTVWRKYCRFCRSKLVADDPRDSSAKLRPRTLDAKWLDPKCWEGCQSLVLKGKIERYEKLLRRVLEWCETETPNVEIDADAIREALNRPNPPARKDRIPVGWRRLRIGEKTRRGDWLENVFDGPWTPLRECYCCKPVKQSWRTVIRRSRSRKSSPNKD